MATRCPVLRPRPKLCAPRLGSRRPFSIAPRRCSERLPEVVKSPYDPRWLSDLKLRLGKCISFGLRPDQVNEAARISHILATEWRELVAGAEGFNTHRHWRGLFRQAVVWGEMDVMVCYNGAQLRITQLTMSGWVDHAASGQGLADWMPGHVNNVNYVRYAENGRVNWTRNMARFVDTAHRNNWIELMSPRSIGLIVGRMRTEYKFPMMWPDRVTVYHKLRSLPADDATSFTLDVMILSEVHQRPAARCVEDIVTYDYRKAARTPVPGFMREVFSLAWQLQEQARSKYGAKVESLNRAVQELELASWKRSGAQEDMGSAAAS